MIDKLVSVQSINGKSIACTTSRQVAETFGKLHKNVLREIDTLIESGKVNRLNFEPIFFKDSMAAVKSYKDILDDCKKTCEAYGSIMASITENPFRENVRKLKA